MLYIHLLKYQFLPCLDSWSSLASQDSWNSRSLIAWGQNPHLSSASSITFPMPSTRSETQWAHSFFERMDDWINLNILCLYFPLPFPLAMLYFPRCPHSNESSILSCSWHLSHGISLLPGRSPTWVCNSESLQWWPQIDSACLCAHLAVASRAEDLRRAGWQEGGREGREIRTTFHKPTGHDWARPFYTTVCHSFKMAVINSTLQTRKELQRDSVSHPEWHGDGGETWSTLVQTW